MNTSTWRRFLENLYLKIFDTYLREGGFPKAIQYDSTEYRRPYGFRALRGLKSRVKFSLYKTSRNIAPITIFYHLSPMETIPQAIPFY